MTLTIGALPARVNLELYQGDDFTFTVTVGDFSLAGAVASAEVRRQPGTVLAAFTATVDETAGTITLFLPAATTATLDPGPAAWDLQVDTAGRIRTLIGGAAKIVAQVTI
jgi:hypothetical protein